MKQSIQNTEHMALLNLIAHVIIPSKNHFLSVNKIFNNDLCDMTNYVNINNSKLDKGHSMVTPYSSRVTFQLDISCNLARWLQTCISYSSDLGPLFVTSTWSRQQAKLHQTIVQASLWLTEIRGGLANCTQFG